MARSTNPFVDKVQHTEPFGPLRAAVEKAGRAARALAAHAAGRPDDTLGPITDKTEQQRRVHVSGLRGSAFVLMAEALRDRLQQKVVIVCPDEESAEDTVSDLRTVTTARVALLPERDILPHHVHSRENLTVRGDRNETLLRILRGDVDIVVTSLLGYLEKTVTVNALTGAQVTINAEDTIDLEELRRSLTDLGYDAVPVVEESGQFAVRGSIIDIFDPSWDLPVRIELFDDEIESLRTFDLDNQRSIDMVQSVTVLPASNVHVDDDATDAMREYLKARDFDDELIDRIASQVVLGRHSYLTRRYAPALGQQGSLLDYFTEPPMLFFNRVGAQYRVYAKLKDDLERSADLLDDDYPLLGFSDYTHDPDYHRAYGGAPIYVWELAPGATGKGDGEATTSAGRDETTAETSPASASEPADGEAPPDHDDSPARVPEPTIKPGEPHIKFAVQQHPAVAGKLDPLIGHIRKLRRSGIDTYIYSETATQRDRMADMLEGDEELVHLPVGWLTNGFIWEDAQLALLTDHEIFGRMLPRPRRKGKKRRQQAFRHDHLNVGDYVVHVDYGIGRFVGLDKLGGRESGAAGNQDRECLIIRFSGDDKIYVPLDQMNLVEKYVGREGVAPKMDSLGSSRWQKSKENARKAVEDIARELLEVYAQRELAEGHAFGPDTAWQQELEASFPYEETPHQLRATDEIKKDMESRQPMDRLVCGDVGFGKTEVAIRAAFKAASQGKQVAVLVPTTLLAMQHYQTFQERLERFPLKIGQLSRFVSTAEQKKVVEGLQNGDIDLVVGTHRLLSKDVKFKRLGLLVVDEEHRFGVKHKERLKAIAKNVDVLSMTATPIPRTLYMSLSGLRQISVIDTPPRNRHPVKTEVLPFDDELIARTITEELRRDGQVFFVHNRVESIASIKAYLERLLPGVRFGVGHGQMTESELEKVILDFGNREYDVLISTMIIESGLDFPNVNTMIVNRADRFGLAQLYQLRGRVGRREKQAYAYFLVPRQLSLTENAMKRLEAMEEFEDLGSGYRLAMRDLEIRGAGNVLGTEQHGHVAAIGFELYCKMLKEAVDRLKGEAPAEMPDCKIDAPYDAYLPATYVTDADERMIIYRRLASAMDADTVGAIEGELRDRFGVLPQPAEQLVHLAEVRAEAARLGVSVIRFKTGPASGAKQAWAPPGTTLAKRMAAELTAIACTLEFAPGKTLEPAQMGRLVETFDQRLGFKAQKTLGVTLTAAPERPLLQDLRNLLQVAHFSDNINV